MWEIERGGEKERGVRNKEREREEKERIKI